MTGWEMELALSQLVQTVLLIMIYLNTRTRSRRIR